TDQLHTWTQGNPYFLEQTLESLIRSGRLQQKGGTWVGWEIREMELPPTVRDALRSRLTALPAEARTLAELAAILGTRAPFNLLRALSPLEEGVLLETLDLLVAREILVEGLGEVGVVYDFNQTLVRETLLAEMGLARARLLHGKVARELEAHFGKKAPEFATTLAFHHLEGDAEEGASNALLYLTLAGRSALERYGNSEAARYLRAALRLLEGGEFGGDPPQDLPASRLEILRDLARALTRLGKYEDAIPYWEAAVKEGERRGLTEEVGEYRRRIGIIRSYHGEPFEALREFDTILSSPPGSISPALAARARLRKGVALEELGRSKEATEELEGVLDAAVELNDPNLLAQAHRALVLLNIWTGRGDRVRSHADQALELARKSGARSVEFWTYWGLAVYEGLLGNTGPMEELVEKAEEAARAMRSPLLRLRSSELAIEQAAATGRWNRGIAIGEQACAVARALSQNTLLPRILVWTSLIYLGKGEVELARPLIEEA
ncbi:MAG: ATP-binding protein, partial [Longimicrobiales bacterium]